MSKSVPGGEFHVNDGKSLAAAGGRMYDLVFSFDSRVHADLDAIAAYIPQVVDLLAPRGLAFFHHSNLAALGGVQYGHRSEDVSAEIFARLVKDAGGSVLCQERVAWGDVPASDCFTLFVRSKAYPDAEMIDLGESSLLGVEAQLAAERFRFFHLHESDEGPGQVHGNAF